MIGRIVDSMIGIGGLLRVRAALALGMTGIGGAYVLINQAMPPEGFTVLWSVSVMHYFATRGANGGG